MLRKLFGIFLLFFILSPIIFFSIWFFTPAKKLDILILDKTVLTSKAQEHISFSWILNYDNYVRTNNKSYQNNIDYFGFFPNDSGKYVIKDFNKFDSIALDSLSKAYDMVYYTDLYGIYEGEWHEQYPNVIPEYSSYVDKSLEHTPRIYGGMTFKEMGLLKKMKEQKKLILAEFNVIASPTPTDIRKAFEDEFGLKWSGWVGRYYETLDTTVNKELPRWMKTNYRLQHHDNWPFTKSGIVFVRDDDKIEILENETHLKIEVPIIHTSKKYMDKYGLPEEMKYPFWFDIISTGKTNNIVSMYKISPNENGSELLRVFGIPETFPAVIEHDSPDYKFHYFAGDFSDSSIGLNSSKFKYINLFSKFSYRLSPQERVSFFWDYYRPMVREIMDEYYTETKDKKGK